MKTGRAFARGMRAVRKRIGMTQAQLAEAVDKHEVFISQLEREKRAPAVETIDAVAAALGLEPWELLKTGAETRERQSRVELLAERVRAVVESWPEADHERLLGVLGELGRLASSARRAAAPRRTTPKKRR